MNKYNPFEKILIYFGIFVFLLPFTRKIPFFSIFAFELRFTKNTLFGIFAFCCVAPLLLVLGYVVIKGFENLSITLFTPLPEPPPSDGGGIRNAIFGTFTVTLIAMAIAVPVGVGGGIYLAEYSRGGGFSKFIRFGTNVLSGVPSIIAGVFIYSTCLLYTSPSPRDKRQSRMPSSA